jgi:chemotaxis protein MotB
VSESQQAKAPVIIIKKIKKVSGGAHGGSWKVAFADFMTTLMALFLVMWLLAMIPPDKRAGVAQYFRAFKYFPVIQKTGDKVFDRGYQVKRKAMPIPMARPNVVIDKHKLKDKLKDMVEVNFPAVKQNISISAVEEGIRIEIVDTEGRLMFVAGSADPTPQAKAILSECYTMLADIENRITVEGHTDASTYKGDEASNWELSVARANAVRRMLTAMGMAQDRISMVAGYAATKPIIPENPLDPRNRRVSIVVLYPESSSGTATP